MPEIQYIERRFNTASNYIIGKARAVCAAYAQQGYELTLRQLYYQFIARDLFPDEWTWSWTGAKWVKDPEGTKNAEPNYKRLGSIVNDARLAGELDWDYIVDRTRNLEELAHWRDPAQLVRAAAEQFRLEKWAKQDYYVEAWIEKDALVGVLETACEPLDVPYFSCRGYTSQSEIWGAAQRLVKKIEAGKQIVILHLGDHDPSGIDMTRDIEERLSMFMAQDLGYEAPGLPPADYVGAVDLEVNRIALNMDQIRAYGPPPNPAKLTDARAQGYVRRFGNESWELDALEPTVLVDLIQSSVAMYRDDVVWEEEVEREESEREVLTAASQRWADVKEFLSEDQS